MSTTTTAPGNKIKAAITSETKSTAELREDCISTHKEYQLLVNRGWQETIVEVLFQFLGGDFSFEDGINEFPYYSVDMLNAMSIPEVNKCLSKHMSSYSIEKFSNMLRSIIHLCESLDHESNKSTIEQYFLEDYTDADSFSIEWWQNRELEYRKKLYMSLIDKNIIDTSKIKM